MAFDLSTAKPVQGAAPPSTGGFDLSTAKPMMEAAPPAPAPMTEGEELTSSIPSRFIAGMTGPAKVLLKLVGPDSIKKQIADVDAMRQRGMEKRGTGFDWAGLAGSMIPGGLITKGVNAVLPATTALGRVGQGMVTGAATAAAQPLSGKDELSTDKLGQIATGAAVGGVIPGVVETGKAIGRTVSKFIEPLTESGRDQILKRFLNRTIPESAKSAVQQATANAPEFVPGSAPHVGQAVSHIPEASALAKYTDVVSGRPAVSGRFATRDAAQEGARKAAIGTIAKTPQDLAAQELLRKTNAAANYGKAETLGVPVDRELKDLFSRPAMKDAIKVAQERALNRGESFSLKGATSVKSLHYIKTALDDMVKDPVTFGIGAGKAADIRDLRTALLNKMPAEYQTARNVYASDSGPINRMKVGQQLAETLTSSLGTSERAAPFANAVRNAPATIKKATDGAQVADNLAKILTQQEMGTVGNIVKDLSRNDEYRRLASKTAMGGSDTLHGRVEPQLPNLLNWYASVANKGLRMIGQDAEPKLDQRAAQLLLNPRQFSQFIGPDVPPRYRPLLEEMMRQSSGAAGTAVGRNY